MARRSRREHWDRIAEALGHRFRDPDLFRQALVHRSYAHETGSAESNEILEFLGDALLGFLVAELIIRSRPDLDEGGMTRLRASLVNTAQLAVEAERIGLGPALLLGRGEERSGGRCKPSLLADAFEALVGAVFLDGGLRAARALARRLFREAVGANLGAEADPKTALQELAQARGWPLPHYRLLEERGPDHAREFRVEVLVAGRALGTGAGAAKRRAEQAAAAAALSQLRLGE